MPSKLSHLNKSQIDELIEKYYSGIRVDDLLEEYNINVISSNLVKQFPPVSIDQKCPYCAVPLLAYYQSRSNIERFGKIQCPKCMHNSYENYCTCKNCNDKRQTDAKNRDKDRRDALRNILDVRQNVQVEFSELNFNEKVYLGALLRARISEDYNVIHCIEDLYIPLAPTLNFTYEILEILLKKKVILIHPESDLEAFTFKSDGIHFDHLKVDYFLNVSIEDKSKVEIVEEILNYKSDFDLNEALNMWRKIALNESLEYLLYKINEVLRTEYTVGHKTISVLKEILSNFSVAQTYSIIYKATANSLMIQAERGTYRKHTANMIIGNCQSYAERAKLNGWNLSNYYRINELPESALSKFFYEQVIKIGHKGFYNPPNEDDIKEVLD